MPTDTVIVFGASRGLGEAIAIALGEAGFAVAAVCRRQSDADAVGATIAETGAVALPLVADVTDYAAVSAVVEAAHGWRGGLAGIVNNAGAIEPIAALADTDPAAWAQLIAVNLTGAYHGIHAALPRLATGGVVVNISSGAAGHAMEGWSAYCASKAGLAMLTQSIAEEYGSRGILAYGFRPGVVDTEMQGTIRASGINRISKLKREDLIQPAIPARGVAWLLRTAPADLSGQEIDIRDESFRSRMA